MAGGKNKEFVQSPAIFLQNHQIGRNPQQDVHAPLLSPGPTNIDLVPYGAGGDVRIESYDGRDHGMGASPIRAYWLPVRRNHVTTIQPGNGANYLFTADLSGCLFASYYDVGGNLTVEHTNAHGGAAEVEALIGPRLTAIFALAAVDRPIKVLTPMAVPAALAIPAAPSNVVHYSASAWVIGGRTGDGWVFRYRRSDTLGTQLL